MRDDARRLLAHRVRIAGVDPKNIAFTAAVANHDAARISWTAGTLHGMLTLHRAQNRWWETLAGPSQGWEPAPLSSMGGILHPARSNMAGYDVAFTYAPNNALSGATFTQVYGRAPTAGEMLPDPLPPREDGGPTDVFFFDLTIGGTRPIAFQAGSSLDIWFPFVLDDSLPYDVWGVAGTTSLKSTRATLFDNVLHVDLPAFTLAPGVPLMASAEATY